MTGLNEFESHQSRPEKYSSQQTISRERQSLSDTQSRKTEELDPTRYCDWEVNGRCADF